MVVWLRPLLAWSGPLFLGFKFRGSCLRRRSGFSMAELISFVVPTQSDKVLLVWELSAGPPAEALSVRVRAEGEGAGITGAQEPRARVGGGAQRTGSQRGTLSHRRMSGPKRKPCVEGRSAPSGEGRYLGLTWGRGISAHSWASHSILCSQCSPSLAFCIQSESSRTLQWPVLVSTPSSSFTPRGTRREPKRHATESPFFRHHQ